MAYGSLVLRFQNLLKDYEPRILKGCYRVYNEKGRAIADLLTLLEGVPDTTEPYRYIDPEQPWRELYFENCTFKRNETTHY